LLEESNIIARLLKGNGEIVWVLMALLSVDVFVSIYTLYGLQTMLLKDWKSRSCLTWQINSSIVLVLF